MLDKWLIILAVCMIITGSINTITTKIADITSSKGINGVVTEFNHPFVQAQGMFLGEFLCLIAFYLIRCFRCCDTSSVTGKREENVKFNPLIFILPAMCDMTATSLMYLGLTWTYASVFQMLRGSVIIWTGLLSMIFLKRKLYLVHWFGMFLVLVGLLLVGVASFLLGNDGANAPHPLWGDIIIICAQIVVAIQMVVEEKFLSKYNIPALQVVGLEGLWGFIMLSLVLVGMYFIPGSSGGNHFENALDAYVQIKNNWIVLAAILGNIFSIAFFNFFGVSITKYSSATSRMITDSIRTVVIWAFSLGVKWQKFQYLQAIGFVILLAGTIVYNELIRMPAFCRPKEKVPESINGDTPYGYENGITSGAVDYSSDTTPLIQQGSK